MAVAKISFQWLIRSEWVYRYVCELQLLYLDAPQFPHADSANSTSLLIPFFVGVCSFTKWCRSTMQASLFLSTSMIWSDVSDKSHFYGLFLWLFSRTYCNNYFLKKTPTKALRIFFYLPSSGGRSLRCDFSQRVLRLGLRKGASSSHFPFSVSSWYILMNQVVFGNGHIPGYAAQSWHSRRSINICGMDPESSQ